MTKVSVIIPTYKRPKDLSKSINSVLSQSLSEIELIVVDDNDPNSLERQETRRIVNSFAAKDKRIIYIEHPQNLNGSYARNTGLLKATGEFVSFLDDDDEYDQYKLEKQYYKLKELPKSYGCIISDCLIRRSGRFIKRLRVDSSERPIVDILSTTYNMGSGSNIFVRKSILKEIGFFDTNLLRHQDYDFMARMCLKYKVFKLSEPLLIVEQRSAHLNTPNLSKLETAKAIYLKKYDYFIKSLSKTDQSRIYLSNYLSLCETAIRCKNKAETKKYYSLASKFGRITNKQKMRLLLLRLYCSLPTGLKRIIKAGK